MAESLAISFSYSFAQVLTGDMIPVCIIYLVEVQLFDFSLFEENIESSRQRCGGRSVRPVTQFWQLNTRGKRWRISIWLAENLKA